MEKIVSIESRLKIEKPRDGFEEVVRTLSKSKYWLAEHGIFPEEVSSPFVYERIRSIVRSEYDSI